MRLLAAAQRLIHRGQVEQRASLNNPADSVSDVFADIMGDGSPLSVTARTSLGYAPISKAVEMIAGDVAKLPLCVYRRTDNEERAKDTRHPIHKITNLHGEPNEETTAFDFWFDLMHDALLTGRGKGLAWIDRVGPNPVGLYRLVAADWKPQRMGGRLFWVNYADKPVAIADEDMLVIRSRRIDGLTPDDPIKLYADTIRVGSSSQRFASKFFENGAHVGGILMIPPGASETATKNVENSVRAKEDPRNWFKSLVLRDGFRFQQTTVDPKQASLFEVDEATARHVARIYNIPPSKLGLSDTVSYNSLESENSFYYDSCLTPWLRRIQGQVCQKMLLPSEKRAGDVFVEHLIDALQWTDASARAAIATQGIASGWLLPEEVRRWHNLPKLPPKPATPAATPAGNNEPPPDPDPEDDSE
jgi:HK97 family phage portal protein